ncbi:MAG: hypothetical protein LBD40_01955 [Puniceicoccales bacterium]|nr:hypothetical protein [Puniceicoccales bacterium]
MKQLHRHLLTLVILTGLWANPLSADPEALFGLSVTPDRLTICFMPTVVSGRDSLPILPFSDRQNWSQDWRVSLNALRSTFEAQWTNLDYREGDGAVYEGLPGVWLEDFTNVPFREGNPLEDANRCGRGPRTPYSRYGMQIALCDADTPQLNFSAFPFDEDTSFAVKLYGAEWVRPWDDTPGLYRRSLPGGWVLRKKTSPTELNRIRFTSSESRVFTIAIQGPGINSGDITQYGSLICLYYVPKPGQVLSRIDRRRRLLREDLPMKLRILPHNFAAADLPPNLDVLLTALKPRRELYVIFPEFGRICFSEQPIRKSWLYQHIGRPFFEAVYVHSYTSFSSYGSLLLANLIWDEKAKGEALREKCSEYFNVDALPQELRDFLFGPNAPFAKLRFQINMQHYMPGEKQVKGSDGKENNVADLVQCLRPHYAVANMPFPDNKSGVADLVNGDFAMKLYGAHFTDQNNHASTSPHLPNGLPSGFLLRRVHIHEGINVDTVSGVTHHFWLASPNNCQIADTDNHDISQSFYSVVMGKCMHYCDDYRDARPWDGDVTAIVTLHIILRPESIEIANVRKWLQDGRIAQAIYRIGDGVAFPISDGEPLPFVAQKLSLAYMGSNEPQFKNPFKELCSLLPIDN